MAMTWDFRALFNCCAAIMLMHCIFVIVSDVRGGLVVMDQDKIIKQIQLNDCRKHFSCQCLRRGLSATARVRAVLHRLCTCIAHARGHITCDAAELRMCTNLPALPFLAAFLDHRLVLVVRHSIALTDRIEALAWP